MPQALQKLTVVIIHTSEWPIDRCIHALKKTSGFAEKSIYILDSTGEYSVTKAIHAHDPPLRFFYGNWQDPLAALLDVLPDIQTQYVLCVTSEGIMHPKTIGLCLSNMAREASDAPVALLSAQHTKKQPVYRSRNDHVDTDAITWWMMRTPDDARTLPESMASLFKDVNQLGICHNAYVSASQQRS